MLEGRLGATTILATGRGGDRGEPDVVAAAPVAGDPAERGEASLPPVGGDADAVDPRAADNRDAPAAVGAGAQHGEGVVADRDALGEPPGGRGVPHRLLLGREVDPGEVELSDLRDGAVAVRQAGFGDCLAEEVVEDS